MERNLPFPFEKDDSRLRILYLYQLLQKKTDENHPLSTREILDRLQAEHNIKIHRTTLPKDIEILRAAGVEVMAERKRTLYYYLADRPLSVPELRLLIDAVLSSKFITEKKSKSLINKLISFTSEPNADKLLRTIHVTGKAKTDNEKGYYIVDAINDAIHLGRKISFLYYEYGSNKEHVLKNEGFPYTVSPYDLIWDGDFYYLTGYCDERQAVRVFRVDRIERQPEILSSPVVPKPSDYRIEKYTQEVFRMFAAQNTSEVTLLCDNDLMKAVIDMFGTDCQTEQTDDNRFSASVNVCVSPTFFRWIFGWNGRIAIAGPDHIREQYKALLENELSKY